MDAIKLRTKLTGKWMWLHRKRLAAATAIAILLVLFVPWTRTPDLFRSRGVYLEAHVESPNSIAAIEAWLRVFSVQVERILLIPVHGWEIHPMPDDGKWNYTSYSGMKGTTLGTGTVTVPITFFTGRGWSDEFHGGLFGKSLSGSYYSTWWGLGWNSDSSTGIDIYGNITGCCFPWQPGLLLHEFAHTLGLRDLYVNNTSGVRGCENRPVLMAGNLTLSGGYLAPVGDVVFSTETLNLSGTPSVEIQETYFENGLNRLTLASHHIEFDRFGYGIGYSNFSYDLDQYHARWTVEEARYLGIETNSTESCVEEELPLPLSSYNYEPIAAIILAVCLAGIAGITRFKMPVPPALQPQKFVAMYCQFLLWTALLAVAVGIVSKGTGLLSVPPLWGWGLGIDTVLVGLGIFWSSSFLRMKTREYDPPNR